MDLKIDDNFVKQYDGLIKERLTRLGIRDPDEFDDLHNKVYERLMTSSAYDPKRGKVSTWLWTICRSVVSNERKKASRSQDVLDQDTVDLQSASSIIGQEDAGTARDEIDRLLSASGLSPRDQRMVIAYHINGLTMQELADKYGLTLRATEQVVYRSMKALRAVASEG